MSLALSIGLSLVSRFVLVATMLSTVCLLRAVFLFTIAATLIAVLPLLVRINRIRAQEAGSRA